jgi:hypothetical protein
MPGYFQQITGGIESYEKYFQSMMPQLCEEKSTLWKDWQCQYRSPNHVIPFAYTFATPDSYWPHNSSLLWNDPAGAYIAPTSLYMGTNNEYWEYPGGEQGGNHTSKRIMGQLFQSDGVSPWGGATVVALSVTQNYMFAGQGTADSNGRYEVPCPITPTDQHFVVAYSTGNPAYGGVTVATIVPTNQDGT